MCAGDIGVNLAPINGSNHKDIGVNLGSIRGSNHGDIGVNLPFFSCLIPRVEIDRATTNAQQNAEAGPTRNLQPGSTVIFPFSCYSSTVTQSGRRVEINGRVFNGSNILIIGNSVRVDGVWTHGPVIGSAINVVGAITRGFRSVFNYGATTSTNDPSTIDVAGSSRPTPSRAFRAPNDDSQAHLIAASIADITRETNPEYDSSMSPEEQERLKVNPPAHLPVNFADVGGLLYSAITISDEQMWKEVLSDKYNINRDDFVNAWTSAKEKDWRMMSTREQWSAIGRAKDQWAMTLEEMAAALTHDVKFQERGAEHFNYRFGTLRRRFYELASIDNMSTAIDATFVFLVDFSTLVSDVAYVLNHDFKPALQELTNLPDRAVVLVDILQHVPKAIELERAVKTILFDQSKMNSDCAICLARLGEAIDVKALKALQRECVGKPGYLSWITLAGEIKSAFKIKDGFNGVPLKMKCGHYFCAGCINKWLESTGKLQCPFRDQDYGVYRSQTVAEMKALHEDYHYGDRRVGANTNAHADGDVGLLTRLLRLLRT